MNAASIIRKIESYGVTLTVLDGALKLSGDQTAVNAVVHLVRQHKTAILDELTGGPTGSLVPLPSHLAESLLCSGYRLLEWTPQGCRAFLAELQAEWPDFHVNGWHGLTMPLCWPVALQDAVQSVYVMSIQDQGEVEA